MKLKRKLYSFNLRKKIIEYLNKKANETDNKNKDPEITNKLVKNAYDNNVSYVSLSSEKPNRFATTKRGKHLIYVNKDTGSNNTLAHEVGHSYYVSGKGQDKLGGKIHKLNRKIKKGYYDLSEKLNKDKLEGLSSKEQDKIITKKSRKIKRAVGSSVSGISGIAAGYKAEEEKEKGNKKKARLISAGSLAVPVLGHAPVLGSEIAASKKGLDYLKRAGINKQQAKNYKKSMAYALGTYGVDLGKNLVINGGGQLVGKGAYKLTHKKKKEE